jgi:hypothetical protein
MKHTAGLLIQLFPKACQDHAYPATYDLTVRLWLAENGPQAILAIHPDPVLSKAAVTEWYFVEAHRSWPKLQFPRGVLGIHVIYE